MRYIEERSIKTQLSLIVLFTTAVALAIAVAALLVYDRAAAREKMKRDLAMMAELVATQSTAAVSFADPASAGDALAVFQANRHSGGPGSTTPREACSRATAETPGDRSFLPRPLRMARGSRRTGC